MVPDRWDYSSLDAKPYVFSHADKGLSKQLTTMKLWTTSATWTAALARLMLSCDIVERRACFCCVNEA